MENLELLKGVLSPTTYALVEEETKDSKIKLADLSTGNYTDSNKYKALDEQLKSTQELLNKKTGEYDELVKTAGDNIELKKQLEEAKANFETEKTNIQNEANAKLKKERVKTQIISSYKPKDINDILPYLDFDKVSEVEGKLVGVDEQVKPLTENKGYLFNTDDGGTQSTGFEHQHSSGDVDAFLSGFDS